jgi:predicted nucleic acid-binding protein
MDAIRVCNVSGFTIFGSATVIAEMDDIANDRKRVRVRNFYDRVISEELTDTADIIDRARDLNVLGLGLRDSYHVAFAEAAGVDYLLTTDDRFERTACRLDLKTKVINPINFFGEYAIWLLSSM